MYEHDVQSKMKILLDRGKKEEDIKKMRPSQPVIDHFAWQYALSLSAIAALTDNENVTRVYRKYLQVDKIPPEERFN